MTKKSEAEICALFTEQAREQGFEVHGEVNGWDLLLVWKGDSIDEHTDIPRRGFSTKREPSWTLKPGDQIAIEAKAKATPEAFGQAIRRQSRMFGAGPDFIGLLAPSWSSGYQLIAMRLGFLLFDSDHYEGKRKKRRVGREREAYTSFASIRPKESMRLEFKRKLWTPPVVAESVVAGAPSPSGLTQWRVAALKICAKLRETGEITSRDFKELKLSMSRWKSGNHKSRWLVDTGRKRGRLTIYTINDPVPPDFPDIGWETERDAIAALGDKALKESTQG